MNGFLGRALLVALLYLIGLLIGSLVRGRREGAGYGRWDAGRSRGDRAARFVDTGRGEDRSVGGVAGEPHGEERVAGATGGHGAAGRGDRDGGDDPQDAAAGSQAGTEIVAARIAPDAGTFNAQTSDERARRTGVGLLGRFAGWGFQRGAAGNGLGEEDMRDPGDRVARRRADLRSRSRPLTDTARQRRERGFLRGTDAGAAGTVASASPGGSGAEPGGTGKYGGPSGATGAEMDRDGFGGTTGSGSTASAKDRATVLDAPNEGVPGRAAGTNAPSNDSGRTGPGETRSEGADGRSPSSDRTGGQDGDRPAPQSTAGTDVPPARGADTASREPALGTGESAPAPGDATATGANVVAPSEREPSEGATGATGTTGAAGTAGAAGPSDHAAGTSSGVAGARGSGGEALNDPSAPGDNDRGGAAGFVGTGGAASGQTPSGGNGSEPVSASGDRLAGGGEDAGRGARGAGTGEDRARGAAGATDVAGAGSAPAEEGPEAAPTATPSAGHGAGDGAADASGRRDDDLKMIRGIGPKNEQRLKDAGITTFAQIAAWSEEQQREIEERLSFPGRIKREDWVAQARVLAEGGTTDFSQRVASGGVRSSLAADDPRYRE